MDLIRTSASVGAGCVSATSLCANEHVHVREPVAMGLLGSKVTVLLGLGE